MLSVLIEQEDFFSRSLDKFLTGNPMEIILSSFQVLFKISHFQISDDVKFFILGRVTNSEFRQMAHIFSYDIY